MKPYAIFGIVLTVLFVMSGCSRLTYDIEPDQTRVYHTLGIKANVKNKETGKKGSFKILLKYDDTGNKMLFLSPLNQIYGLLVVEGENTTLVNTKKKRYWKGRFNTLLQEIWGMDFEYVEFKRLLVEGVVPEEKLKEKNIDVSIEKDTEGKELERVTIETSEMQVKLKITSRETGKGAIRFGVDLKKMEQAEIRELLE
jgi:hypothetical protein